MLQGRILTYIYGQKSQSRLFFSSEIRPDNKTSPTGLKKKNKTAPQIEIHNATVPFQMARVILMLISFLNLLLCLFFLLSWPFFVYIKIIYLIKGSIHHFRSRAHSVFYRDLHLTKEWHIIMVLNALRQNLKCPDLNTFFSSALFWDLRI